MTFNATLARVVAQRSQEGSDEAERAGKSNGDGAGLVTPNSMRGRRRLARILEAATQLFLRDGYAATSIEAVLDASGGSKATLYSYFSTKDELFRAVVQEAIRAQRQPTLELGANPKSALVDFIVQAFEVMSSPRHRALLRVVVAERERFPDLARLYYDEWPLRNRRMLTSFFAELEQRKLLPAGAAEPAADHFVGLITHPWLLESLVFGGDSLPSIDTMRAKAERAVERFLTFANGADERPN
ncbi:MAG TPA: TetR/AcrR family transcriptional regulator [Gammaproteobacteria bacterium]